MDQLAHNNEIADIWKDYFGVWISPPNRIMSWLNLLNFNCFDINRNNGKESHSNIENEGKFDFIDNQLKKEKIFPKLILLRPAIHQQVDLESKIQTSCCISTTEPSSEYDTKSLQNKPSTFRYNNSLFAFSATDPLGKQVSSEENKRANACLWKELLGLKEKAEIDNRHEVFLFHGAGFIDDGRNWFEKSFNLDFQDNDEQISETQLFDFVEQNFPSPEKGFLVAISTSNAASHFEKGDGKFSGANSDDLRNHILNLARKYQQGGIFEFRKLDRNRIIRLTVPVCIADCESQVELKAFPLKTSSEDSVTS